MIRKIALLAACVVLLQGCKGSIADRVFDSVARDNYTEYRLEADRLNLERERAGLQPQPILTFEEWMADTD